jgi:polyphosphate glucokinase
VKTTTLTVDCGGTGIKASIFNDRGQLIRDLPYLRTPYPLEPNLLIEIIKSFLISDISINRLTVGLPGMIRDGKGVNQI